MCLHAVKNLQTRKYFQANTCQHIYCVNMTSFLVYVTATIRALFAWRGVITIQIIRCRVTCTLRQPQINQDTCSKGGPYYYISIWGVLFLTYSKNSSKIKVPRDVRNSKVISWLVNYYQMLFSFTWYKNCLMINCILEYKHIQLSLFTHQFNYISLSYIILKNLRSAVFTGCFMLKSDFWIWILQLTPQCHCVTSVVLFK